MREEKFGRYVLVSRLGYGGMAEVFLARTDGIGGFEKKLAIKRLLPYYTEDEQTVELLADEAKITVRLSHPNIVQVFDFGRVEGHYFIAMEFIDGLDLKSAVEVDDYTSEPMPLDVALFVTISVLDALDYAHNRKDEYGEPLGIIHRDVSPQNVLISRHGQVKLTDFGVARAAIQSHVSIIGDIRGKFSYMPPEQACGGEIDQRIDIFAAGVILYELLTGRQPYRSTSSGQQMAQLRQELTPPSELRPELPRALDDATRRALALDPDNRFASAREFSKALGAALEIRNDPLRPQRRLAELVERRLDGEEARPPEDYGQRGNATCASFSVDPSKSSGPLRSSVSGEIGAARARPSEETRVAIPTRRSSAVSGEVVSGGGGYDATASGIRSSGSGHFPVTDGGFAGEGTDTDEGGYAHARHDHDEESVTGAFGGIDDPHGAAQDAEVDDDLKTRVADQLQIHRDDDDDDEDLDQTLIAAAGDHARGLEAQATLDFVGRRDDDGVLLGLAETELMPSPGRAGHGRAGGEDLDQAPTRIADDPRRLGDARPTGPAGDLFGSGSAEQGPGPAPGQAAGEQRAAIPPAGQARPALSRLGQPGAERSFSSPRGPRMAAGKRPLERALGLADGALGEDDEPSGIGGALAELLRRSPMLFYALVGTLVVLVGVLIGALVAIT